ncbi:uncharacterized protein MEPE_04050 [Melanopsichium pennsylvanicum]|uniref:Membrane anchor Opy2 N-terminal domain-containing protein n=1 Tax=Melanopsichium pennsylvanicum TaxID=63383 RepID=A0AAJ4XP28_9BASI|nr:uncharacterized protein MEPE_04050 [Melanopsichium pennsylvanicum]
MKRSHPQSFMLKKRQACAVCDNIAPCPACPKGKQCQQIFRSSCQDCPVNKCVAIPGYSADSGTNKSALGGGLAAFFIVAFGGAFAFWFWRRLKAKRRRIALHEDAIERREKVKNEKEATTLQLGVKPPRDSTSPFAMVDEDDDTEYTQVTGVLNEQAADSLGSLVEPTAFRRRSFGAATHLSRITEGVEEEDDEEALPTNARRNTVASTKSDPRSFASGAGPRVSIGSGTSFGSHNIIPIAFRPSPLNNNNNNNKNNNNDTLSDHEPQEYSPVSSVTLPTTAHRAIGAPAVQINSANQGPIRPTRAPDLNLRLPEIQRPHQPSTSSPLASTASESAQPAYDFMSIDPVEALNSSGPYTRSDRRLSGATINTIASTQSNGLSYVLSAPQVITPVSAEGVRRVQLGNGGKAQLFKVASLNRKEKASASESNGGEISFSSSVTSDGKHDPFRDPTVISGQELVSPPSNRFGASSRQGGGEGGGGGGGGESVRFSTVSTSTLGIPFGENPFGPSLLDYSTEHQASPSDAEDRISWLGSSPPVSPNSATAESTCGRVVAKMQQVEQDESVDPFKDPNSVDSNFSHFRNNAEGEEKEKEGGEVTERASIGGLSLLGEFPFDFTASTNVGALPEDALRRVEQFQVK